MEHVALSAYLAIAALILCLSMGSATAGAINILKLDREFAHGRISRSSYRVLTAKSEDGLIWSLMWAAAAIIWPAMLTISGIKHIANKKGKTS